MLEMHVQVRDTLCCVIHLRPVSHLQFHSDKNRFHVILQSVLEDKHFFSLIQFNFIYTTQIYNKP